MKIFSREPGELAAELSARAGVITFERRPGRSRPLTSLSGR